MEPILIAGTQITVLTVPLHYRRTELTCRLKIIPYLLPKVAQREETH